MCSSGSYVGLTRRADSVEGLLGFGSFGTVVAADDIITGRAVAVKLLHKAVNGSQDARVEEQVYDALVAGCCANFRYVTLRMDCLLCAGADRTARLFAEVLGSGEHRGFHCIVFERCELSLYGAIQGQRGVTPFPRRQVAEIAEQVLRGIDCMYFSFLWFAFAVA